ncbi:MAG: hypothetical protein U5N58_01410 [Actinomycetota bacterium]|nr:hypothetical protein [Actinomycetota bacterium]
MIFYKLYKQLLLSKVAYYDHQTGSDFAVFECRLINYGFVPQKENSVGYILANLTLNYNIIKSELETARRGEAEALLLT